MIKISLSKFAKSIRDWVREILPCLSYLVGEAYLTVFLMKLLFVLDKEDRLFKLFSISCQVIKGYAYIHKSIPLEITKVLSFV